MKTFTSLRCVVLVMLALSILAASSSAQVVAPESMGATRAAQKKAFNPKTSGAIKVANSQLSQLSPIRSYGLTWCRGKRPGLRIKKVGKAMSLFISYSRLATNYSNQRLIRSASKKQQKQYKTLAAQFRKKAKIGGKYYVACASASGSGSGSSIPFDATIRWVPLTRSRTACQATSAPATNELRFALCDKEGIVRTGSSRRGSISPRSGSSDVQTFNSSGSLQEAVTEGAVTIGALMVGPTGWTYMGLNAAVNLADTSSGSGSMCAFIRIREATGVPDCVDATIQSVAEIQFDNNGGVYYRGSTGSINVLRRELGRVVTDLITSSAMIGSYAVTPDGWAVITGSTLGGSGWTRLISPTGELTNLYATQQANWVKLFPDGNVYFGMWGSGFDHMFGVTRLINSTKTLDAVMWINSSWATSNGPAYFSRESICAGSESTYFCSTSGSRAIDFQITQSGRVLALSGGSAGYVLAEYWPNPRRILTSVSSITTMRAAGDELILSGTNGAGQNVTYAYNPQTGVERALIPAASQTEIYHLAYSSSTGEVFFDGLRFSNNSYVVGKVNVSTGELTYLGTTGVSFSDFQAF